MSLNSVVPLNLFQGCDSIFKFDENWRSAGWKTFYIFQLWITLFREKDGYLVHVRKLPVMISIVSVFAPSFVWTFQDSVSLLSFEWTIQIINICLIELSPLPLDSKQGVCNSYQYSKDTIEILKRVLICSVQAFISWCDLWKIPFLIINS